VAKSPSPQLDPPRQWSDRRGAAAHLGVALRTVDELTAAGVIATYRLPGHRRVLIDLIELDALVAAGRRQVGVR
jgi:excisionase family DNA binding protein